MAKPDYEWIAAGEEWSEPWGGSAPQWFGSILPRIQACLPANTILEIASGFGRWSYYLKKHCCHLHLVDPAADCIEACQRRFASDAHLSYHINDGRSLKMISNGSIDFAFSFDSLVHADAEERVPIGRDAVREGALESGCAFWDTYTIMGGKGAIRAWQNESPPKAAKDGIHLAWRGYRELGTKLAEDLMRGYTP